MIKTFAGKEVIITAQLGLGKRLFFSDEIEWRYLKRESEITRLESQLPVQDDHSATAAVRCNDHVWSLKLKTPYTWSLSRMGSSRKSSHFKCLKGGLPIGNKSSFDTLLHFNIPLIFLKTVRSVFFSQASARALCKVLVCPWLGRLVEATWTKVIKEPREAMERKESWIIETSPALRNTISAPPKTLKFPLGIHVKVRGMMQIPKACGAACSDAIILACGWRCEFNRSLGEITGVFQGCFLGRTVAYRGHGWQALLKHVETLNRLIDLL